MKTTKILMLAAMLATTVSASAQFSNAGKSMGTSDLLQPAASKKYVRLGAAMNSVSIRFEDFPDLDSKLGYEVAFGFQKPLGNQGIHLNGEAGFASRGGSRESKDSKSKENFTLTTHQLFVAPHVGWELSVANGVTIDPHLGLYVAYDLFGNCTDEGNEEGRKFSNKEDLKDMEDKGGWSAFDAGLNIGCGVWINNKWNIDLRYKTSFIDCFNSKNVKHVEKGYETENFSYGITKSWVLTVAYAF